MRLSALLAVAVAGSLASPGALVAQEDPGPVRGFVGGEFLVASPVGEFAENVGTGFGVGVHGRLAFDDSSLFSLRGDLGFLNYGNETIRICVTQPCRVTGDLTTSNNIVFGGVGPELGVGSGAVRAYTHAGVGFAYFGTTSSVEGANNQGNPFATSTNSEDVTFAWMGGGGFQVRLSGRSNPVYLDLGARYHGNGEAEYLRKGDIQDLPDGNVVTNPRQSETNLWTIRFGVSVGLRPGGGPRNEVW